MGQLAGRASATFMGAAALPVSSPQRFFWRQHVSRGGTGHSKQSKQSAFSASR